MIICAAIKITFQRGRQTVTAVVPGHRHSDCWELMVALGVPTEREEKEGFIDHRGDFLDRYEALKHAIQCGQLSETTRETKTGSVLYSEDLY